MPKGETQKDLDEESEKLLNFNDFLVHAAREEVKHLERIANALEQFPSKFELVDMIEKGVRKAQGNER